VVKQARNIETVVKEESQLSLKAKKKNRKVNGNGVSETNTPFSIAWSVQLDGSVRFRFSSKKLLERENQKKEESMKTKSEERNEIEEERKKENVNFKGE